MYLFIIQPLAAISNKQVSVSQFSQFMDADYYWIDQNQDFQRLELINFLAFTTDN